MFRCFDCRTSIDLYSEVVPMKSNEDSGFSTSNKLKTIVYRSPKMDIIALQWKSGQEVSLYRLNWQRVSSFKSLSKALTVRNLIIDTHSVNLKEPFIVWSCAESFFCMGLIFWYGNYVDSFFSYLVMLYAYRKKICSVFGLVFILTNKVQRSKI